MKILVIGGTHGNEPLGVELVKLLRKRPIKTIDTLIANPRAVRANTRFVETDLNRSFPGKGLGSYEQKRARKVLDRAKQYDLVFDIHNTRSGNNDCVFVGESCESQLLKVADILKLRRVIVADYECINKYAPNCISIEISLDSPLNVSSYWNDQLKKILRLRFSKSKQNLEFYKFVQNVSVEDKDRLKLSDWSAFKPIPKKDVKKLGLDGMLYPMFVGKGGYRPEVYAGLLRAAAMRNKDSDKIGVK